jgi:hypothetical protein
MKAVTAGLSPEYSRLILNKVSKDNALIIASYIVSMKSEINLSDYYRRVLIKILGKFSIFCFNNNNNKSLTFELLNRENVLAFLNSFRKPEAL